MVDSLLSTIHGPFDLKALDFERLPELAEELRQAICGQVSTSGGHLAPNLGVVELTLALHYVFDLAHDRLLFDVGHQCYAHKLLTGRQSEFTRLRQADGVAGFPEPRESSYDLFSVGHAGTAASTAVGMARGDTRQGNADRRVVALVGDSAIVNGLSLEGLNNAGTLERQLLVILNDNGMSIAKPQGGLARVFAEMTVESDRPVAGSSTRDRAWGAAHDRFVSQSSPEVSALVDPEHPLRPFGLTCVGPVDGHDVLGLVQLLTELKQREQPVLLHCKTIKGNGFEFTADDPTAFHACKPFRVEGSRAVATTSGGSRSFTSAFSEALGEQLERDERIVAVTAAMPDGTGLDKLMQRFPERVLDVGICEGHATAMCAGMAKAGLKPFLAVYSTFAQRALDQVFQEVALQGLPLRVCLDRAGYVGGDGAVHHGFMDLALFRPFPGSVLLAASDEPNLRAALAFQAGYDEGASFLRFPRDEVAGAPLWHAVEPFELGRAQLVIDTPGPPQLAILAYGTEVYEAAQAVAELRTLGFEVQLWDARFAKPVDIELLRRLTTEQVPVLTVEDHSTIGGFGTAVLEACNDARLAADRIARLGMPERWVYQDSRQNQLAAAGLDGEGILRRTLELLEEFGVQPRTARVRLQGAAPVAPGLE